MSHVWKAKLVAPATHHPSGGKTCPPLLIPDTPPPLCITNTINYRVLVFFPSFLPSSLYTHAAGRKERLRGGESLPSEEVEATTIQEQSFPPSMTFQIEMSLIFALAFSCSNLIFPAQSAAEAVPSPASKICNSTQKGSLDLKPFCLQEVLRDFFNKIGFALS